MSDILKKALEFKNLMDAALYKELDKKARLGQYAIMYKKGEVVRLEAEEIRELLNKLPAPEE